MKLIDKYFMEYNEHTLEYGKDKSLVFYQVGSFYEAYQSDTQGYNLDILSDLMNCAISKRDKTQPLSSDNVKMLGFPLQSLNKYLTILVEAGYQIKVIEQNAIGKIHGKINPINNGKIERTTKGIYSRGTIIDLDNKDNNYILSLWLDKDDNNLDIIGVTICDISTGLLEIKDSLCNKDDSYQALDEVATYINTYNPSEIILSSTTSLWTSEKLKYLEIDKNYYIFDSKDKLFHKLSYQKHILSKIFNQKNPIEYLEIEQYHYGRISLMLLLNYIEMHNPELLKNLTNVQNYNDKSYLYLGNNATQQLNVLNSDPTQNKIGNRYKSLFDVVNFTLTPMGRRLLKRELAHPLTSVKEINYRYELIQKFSKIGSSIKDDMQYICDMEKMHKKLQIGELNPNELYKWIISYQRAINLHTKVEKIYGLSDKSSLEIYNILNSTFNIDKLISITNITENIFLPKVNLELDTIQQKIDENRELLKKIAGYIEEFSIEKTKKKIVGCKVEFNERDGWHLITTKKRWKEIEDDIKKNNIIINAKTIIKTSDFIGKDNSVSGTKIFSEQLKKLSDELIKNEFEISNKVQEAYKKYCVDFCEKYKFQITHIITWISFVDFIYSGAMCIEKYRYTIPEILEDTKSWFSCEKIRHPIVEQISDNYIPFDMNLGNDFLITGITLFGLNSAGKSTLQKSVGLNIILAQMGYPVACTKFKYSPYNSLFTRISGNDNLFKGLSSFTVEMLEIRNILKRTDSKSLIIADEVCRGTEYESGLIIVLTMIKILSEKNASFITASHLHEIVDHEIYKKLKNVKSFHIKILYNEKTNVITYNRELCEGSGDNFYGLLVAKSLIDDRDFLQISTDIKTSMKSTKVSISKYNNKMIKDECEICKRKVKDDQVSLETHHIIFQKDAVNNIINNYQHKNTANNLVIICQKCHDDVDRGNINIQGKIETSKGEELVIVPTNISFKKDTTSDYVETKIIELSKKKLSQKMIKEKLSYENINISISKISKIIASAS
jgi:DNA mismatch repair protein MutS